MLSSYVGVLDPKGQVIPVRCKVAGADDTHRQSHTHIYLVDEKYTCNAVAVRTPTLPLTPEIRDALRITRVHAENDWTLYVLCDCVPADHAAIMAERLCRMLGGLDYRPKIPVPLMQGEYAPYTGPIPIAVGQVLNKRRVDSLLANETPQNYVQAEAMYDVAVQLPTLREACPLLYRCATSPGLVTSSDALTYVYYSYASKLTGLPMEMLTRSALRPTLPRLTYVPTCRMVRELAPGYCAECPRYRAMGTPIDVLAAMCVAERIVHRMSPSAIVDMDLRDLANVLDPIRDVDGAAFHSITQSVARNMGGTQRVVKALQERLMAYRTHAGTHPVRRLTEAYKLRQYLTRLEESASDVADIILSHFAEDGAQFATRHDGSYMVYAGKTTRLTKCREFETWIYPMTGALSSRGMNELATAVEVNAAKRAAATDSTGFGLYRGTDAWYIYQAEENPEEDSWRDAHTMEPVNLGTVYTGPQCFDWSTGMTSVLSFSHMMRTTAERMGFAQEDFAYLLAYMASSLYLQHIPREWVKPMYVQVRKGQADRASVIAELLSRLYYGHDMSQDLEPWLCCAREDMPIAISYYIDPARVRKQRIRGQLEIFVTSAEPDADCFCVPWDDSSIRVTPWWKDGLKTHLTAKMRAPMLSSFLATYRDAGFDAVLEHARQSETPHLAILRQYAFRISDAYSITKDNIQEQLPAILRTYWRSRGFLPGAVKCADHKTNDVTFRLPVTMAHSSFQTMALDLGRSVAPNVSPRVVSLAYNRLNSRKYAPKDNIVFIRKGTYLGTRMYYVHIQRAAR